MDPNAMFETPAQEVARIRATFPAWGPTRVLSAIGHPGYGAAFARRVLAEIERTGHTAHAVIRGDR